MGRQVVNRVATDAEILKALQECDTRIEAAKKVGLTERRFYQRVANIKGAQNPSVCDLVPDGHQLKGVSSLIGDDGEIKAQWVKTSLDMESAKAAQEAAIKALSEALPRQAPISPPKLTHSNLLNLYTLTDCHVGMLAWHREAGEDWDLRIAEDTLVRGFLQLIASSPDAETAIVNQLGDFLHTDGLVPATPASGHILDADGRYQKIVECAVRILRVIINAALKKHKRVIVLMQDANHDPVGGTWLRVLFSALYEKDKRVRVETSPSPYIAHQHGSVMLGFHHGHLTKNASLPILMATQFSEMWGKTRRRYCHTGHLHHADEKELNGMTVIQHPTMAAKDAYAARGGWLTTRAATSITYHSSYGQVARVTITPEMLHGDA